MVQYIKHIIGSIIVENRDEKSPQGVGEPAYVVVNVDNDDDGGKLLAELAGDCRG